MELNNSVDSGSKTLVDAVSECIRYWVANCDKTYMGIGSLVTRTSS